MIYSIYKTVGEKIMKKNIEGVGEVSTPSTPKEKLQNFWYHYKWHSTAALVLIVAILICTFQFCGMAKYDAYIMYAGGTSIGRTTEDGDFAEIEKVISAIKGIAEDFDENGEVSPNFVSYYYLSPEEAAKEENVNETLLASDKKSLQSLLEHSEYYLCFISVAVYEQYHKVGDDEMFISLKEFEGMADGVEYYADNAIKLSSLDAAELSGFSILGEDTLICIRQPSILGGKSKEHKAYVDNAKKMLTNLLSIKTS